MLPSLCLGTSDTIADKLWELVSSQPTITPAQKAAIKSMYGEVIRSLGHSAEADTPVSFENAAVARAKGGRQRRPSSQFLRPNVEDRTEVDEEHLPFLNLKRKTGTSWAYSQKLTNICRVLAFPVDQADKQQILMS